VRAVLDGPAPHLARTIGEGLRRAPGRDVARAALLGGTPVQNQHPRRVR
jgi:zeaxanthin glucosyltransferase